MAILVLLALALTAGPTASMARTSPNEHITLKLTKRTGKKKLTLTHTGRATGPVAGRVRAKSTLLSRSTDALSSATGVNLDEEMTLLLDLERSYQASSKLITTIDNMYGALLAAAGR